MQIRGAFSFQESCMTSTLLAAVLTVGMIAPVQQTRTNADDQRANAHYRSGWEHLIAEAWSEAAREFEAALAINPQFKLAYYGLGRAHMGQKHFPDAIKAYEQCRDLFVTQASRNLSSKAEADRVMDDDMMQLDMAIQQLSSGPQGPSTQVRIAELRAQKQRFENRTHSMANMSLTSPVPAFVSLALGSAYFRSSRMPEAEREYKTAVDTDPKYGEAWSNLAVVYLETGRYDDAEKAVKSAEKAGFRVHPQLKDDIAKRRKSGEN
jgi:tetratricopeptide (TPR) repeat protein